MVEGSYQVVLLSVDAETIDVRPCDTLKEAKEVAKYRISDAFARVAETSHDNWRTEKVEVRNAKGECVWDKFRVVK